MSFELCCSREIQGSWTADSPGTLHGSKDQTEVGEISYRDLGTNPQWGMARQLG
jgi:hypothetical protein